MEKIKNHYILKNQQWKCNRIWDETSLWKCVWGLKILEFQSLTSYAEIWENILNKTVFSGNDNEHLIVGPKINISYHGESVEKHILKNHLLKCNCKWL